MSKCEQVGHRTLRAYAGAAESSEAGLKNEDRRKQPRASTRPQHRDEVPDALARCACDVGGSSSHQSATAVYRECSKQVIQTRSRTGRRRTHVLIASVVCAWYRVSVPWPALPVAVTFMSCRVSHTARIMHDTACLQGLSTSSIHRTEQTRLQTCTCTIVQGHVPEPPSVVGSRRKRGHTVESNRVSLSIRPAQTLA